MVTLEKFKQYMCEFEELQNRNKKLDEALKLFSEDFSGFADLKSEDFFLTLVANLFITKSEDLDFSHKLLSYFIYDLNYGKDADSQITVNDKVYSLKSLDEFYNCAFEIFS